MDGTIKKYMLNINRMKRVKKLEKPEASILCRWEILTSAHQKQA